MFIKLDGKLINLDNVSEVLMSTDYDGKPELRFRDNTGETFESFRLDKVPTAKAAYEFLCSTATFDFDDIPTPAAPQPVTADAGYTAGTHYVYSPRFQQIGVYFNAEHDAQTCANILNQETQALRSQLHAANEKVAALEAEGEQWKQHRELLEATLTSCKQLYDGEQVLMAEKCREVDFMQDRIDDLNQMVDEARQERDSLKARLAECEHAHTEASKQRDAATELYSGKHERIEALKRELEVSRDARKALEYVINHAFKELKTYDGDNGAIIAAKLMLDPYVTHEAD